MFVAESENHRSVLPSAEISTFYRLSTCPRLTPFFRFQQIFVVFDLKAVFKVFFQGAGGNTDQNRSITFMFPVRKENYKPKGVLFVISSRLTD